jgi:23S rRNA pseudouridine1911/1915/1917 synthase
MIITVSHPDSIVNLLLKEFGTASRTTLKNMVVHGNILVNGKIVRNPSVIAETGDRIEYRKAIQHPASEQSPFPVVFEDRDLVVVEKPPGILTYGELGSGGTSLYKEFSAYHKQKTKGQGRIFVVHRLDREVSGLVLFAKRERIQRKLKDNWEAVIKRYYALVEGRPPGKSGTFRSYLAEDDRQRVHSVGNPAEGKLAVTGYRTLKEFPEYTLLEITLETGRKNQIRVHLSEAGCPVAGDYRYGADYSFRRRIRLHACYLSFPHPVTGKTIECTLKIPPKFTVILPEDETYK